MKKSVLGTTRPTHSINTMTYLESELRKTVASHNSIDNYIIIN